MSQIQTDFILTFQPDTNPKKYGALIVINDAEDSTSRQSVNHTGTMTEPEQLYTAEIDLPNVSSEPVILNVDFGALDIHPETGEIEMILKDGEAEVDRKKVKVKEAQDESRPIGIDS